MHELGITRNIVAIASENAGSFRVKRILLRLGEHSGLDVRAVNFCFETVAQGTVCEGAVLETEIVKGRAKCQACGAEFAAPQPVMPCPHCGKFGAELLTGREIIVHQIETKTKEV